MENKPFDLQSPIKIASEYGGNKQKIAQASKMGLVDPTAALLAGMFIDRMRSAQQAEMTPQQTVADKVFSPQPPPPPPGAMPQGGPPQGGPPRGGPPMPTGGAPMPPPPQGGPPMGMAGGGLMSIPVPDAMFDEPDNGGYANGGMVAFASAGEVRAKWEKIIRDPKTTQKEREAVWNELTAAKKVEAAKGSNLSDLGISSDADNTAGFAAPAVAGFGTTLKNAFLGPGPSPIPGLSAEEATQAINAHNMGTTAFGGKYLNYPDKPTPNNFTGPVVPAADAAVKPTAAVIPTAPTTTAAVVAPRMGVPASKRLAAVAPVAPTATTATGDGLDEYNKMLKGGYADRDAAVTDIKKLMGADDAHPAVDALREANKKALSPEEQKKGKEQDMWMALAQIGANMAATKSPNFMQAVGESMQAALPGMIAARKERKAEVKDALKEQAALEGMDRQEAREYAKMGLDEYNRHSDILMKAQELADNKEYHKAALVLQRYEAENTNRYQQGSLGVQRAALSKPTAEEADQALFNKNPTAYQKRYTAQYAGRGTGLGGFGGRLGTGGGGTDPYAGFSVVGQ